MLALIVVFGNARSQGAEVEIPTLADAREHFDNWLLGDAEPGNDDHDVMKQALGLTTGR